MLSRLRREPRRIVNALNGVSLAVRRGETLGIVGESGCGKSTLARCIVRLYEADAGEILFEGVDVMALQGSRRRLYNRRVQMVFQDPYGSLNPRMPVGQSLAEALAVHSMRAPGDVAERVVELLDLVGLPPDAAGRYPYEFSGGQRQRVGIAPALAVEPQCLIADEIVSALDVSVQAQIINLPLDLQARLGLTPVFVSHDLRVVRHISHRVGVMYLGRIVETGKTEQLFQSPRHPYTAALLAAAPDMDPARKSVVDAVKGELPSPLNMPGGCPFHPRCPKAFDPCYRDVPALEPWSEGQLAACHLPRFD